MERHQMESKLREYVRKIATEKLSENKDITTEGLIDSVLNHISDVLKKSRDARFERELDALSKKTPGAKKKVDSFRKNLKQANDNIAVVDKLASELGL